MPADTSLANERLSKTILVIDDDPVVLVMAEEVFSDDEFTVATLPSGEAALEQIDEINPDIVLLDIMMPGMDGFETCHKIKQIPRFANIPIIMLTGRDDMMAIEQAYDAGAWDFNSKPIKWPLLRHRVQYSLRAFEAFSNERKSARLSKTIDKSSNEIIVFDHDTLRVLSANTSALVNLDYVEHEIEQLLYSDIQASLSHAALKHHIQQSEKQPQKNVHFELKRRDGSVYPAEGVILHNTEETPHVCISILNDITERKKAESEMQRLAFYDDLTGLPNRRLFKEHVHKALGAAKRAGKMCALCILDLDGFKSVNDALGHSRGDLLLKQVSDRLTAELRQTDSLARADEEEAINGSNFGLARMGGDEFLILLSDYEHSNDPARIADRILRTISLPYNLHGQELNVTASLGIALYPNDGDNMDVLMRHADKAMYTAKNTGKNNYAYYSRDKDTNSLTRLNLETELRKALDRDELELYYQPQFNARTGELVGAEALLRWNHPQRSLLYPDEFIPLAEETGLILPIGDWVLQNALSQAVIWEKQFGPDFKCAVNISAMQLRQDDFLHLSKSLVAKEAFKRCKLVLELTESSAMTSTHDRIDWLRELQNMGVEIAIDDFGTGYSSLSYLKKLPINYLKIDRSFLTEITSSSDDQVIVKTIFSMAEALNLNVVVEGVETQEQYDLVNNMGDCLTQGFLHSPALPAHEFETFARQLRNVVSPHRAVTPF